MQAKTQTLKMTIVSGLRIIDSNAQTGITWWNWTLYPVIWQGGYYDHKLWGVMFLVIVIYGQGRVSLDNIICKQYH
ncbi:hypothetical protein AZO1586I_1400 [Bathymodiolus thermophilus thioautotrophic gill symbiont]|uniref:Uncharacterized protein n=2 Tax=Bathymodiolus thermophilus thioautotrophic gill symbiont TaxID=2360 RepID=A0ABM8M8P2_9GAMM|nr:hypothetical protein AZO1586I_1400 [Bathymodiolus thermophilus thioautotrophic gill symbiont]